MGPWPKFAGAVLLTVGAGRLRHYDCARREVLREAALGDRVHDLRP